MKIHKKNKYVVKVNVNANVRRRHQKLLKSQGGVAHSAQHRYVWVYIPDIYECTIAWFLFCFPFGTCCLHFGFAFERVWKSVWGFKKHVQRARVAHNDWNWQQTYKTDDRAKSSSLHWKFRIGIRRRHRFWPDLGLFCLTALLALLFWAPNSLRCHVSA